MDEIREKFGQMPDAEREELKRRIAELESKLADAEELIAEQRKGVDAVSDLIAESWGVAGLHLNGDIAPWSDLLKGGIFEEWLRDFSAISKS